MKHTKRVVSVHLRGPRRWYGMGMTAAVALCSMTVAHADVMTPFEGESLLDGMQYDVSWDPLGACSTVDIRLYRGTRLVCTIATGETDDGLYRWTVDACDLPACDYVLEISCPGESVRSSRFAVAGLLLDDVIAGSRNVQLDWNRLKGDTLGSSRAMTSAPTDSTPGVARVFGGYNVWRRVFDNQLDPSTTQSFTKIRTYDVSKFNVDTIPSGWTFGVPWARFGAVLVEIDEETSELQTWFAAQTFTTPATESYELCNIRMYNGTLIRRWDVTMRVTPVDAMGLPVLTSPIATVTRPLGTLNNESGFLWQPYTFATPIVLSPGTQYAIVFSAVPNSPPNPRDPRMTWVRSTYDALPGGSSMVSRDAGATWEVNDDMDFAFVLGGTSMTSRGACVDLLGQRNGGSRQRAFNDPDSILAFSRDENGDLMMLDPTGPFNGFELEYAVTAFERVRLSAGNVELTGTCEDTLFSGSGFPLGVQPSRQSRWPEIIFPQSRQPSSAPLLANVYPVPNPYVRDVTSPSFPRWERPGERRIDFVNLPADALIRVYTLAGDLVRTFRHTDSHGTARWDLRNEDDEIVVSGVYIWMVTTESGETRRGQLVIVR